MPLPPPHTHTHHHQQQQQLFFVGFFFFKFFILNSHYFYTCLLEYVRVGVCLGGRVTDIETTTTLYHIILQNILTKHTQNIFFSPSFTRTFFLVYFTQPTLLLLRVLIRLLPCTTCMQNTYLHSRLYLLFYLSCRRLSVCAGVCKHNNNTSCVALRYVTHYNQHTRVCLL